MLQNELIVDSSCSVERSFEILGGAWTFLVLREALLDNVVQFDSFQSNLGIARESLKRVLKRLVRHGVMEHRPLNEGGRRKGYFLTEQGRDLLPALVAALNWGQDWSDKEPTGERLVHTNCGQPLKKAVVCSECHQVVDPRDVRFESRIRTRSKGRERFAKMRYVEQALLERQRPCSIARTMATIGDPWSFLIIRECFYGVRRFDIFQRRLSIASNILAARLKRFVAAGILKTRPVPDQPHLSEYRMTEKGMALYAIPLAIIAWGDKWLADDKGPPLILTHKSCGHTFSAKLFCQTCKTEVDIDQVTYRPSSRSDCERT
ncbi:helix-turn-helix domain-containing protein [uncultured Sneathiella sp.]|jgi:DNA-binding HxlR family transcriptional regulator|uniref:winged helix-turn-helix transcriptional regulator n=1 Tax=uncultured Sneathiella sp. TaxID=879315 RepID=UPI0030D83D10|tara:strand:+ start:571 stop:1527 length:957 start_codon:yes stop_codon:yes gene_type:complete